jgi:hypothetical protein
MKMRLSLPCAAAAAALLGSSLLVGCASEKTSFPASPVAAPLSDFQAIELAEDYLSANGVDEYGLVSSVEPTGDGNLVSFRSDFDADATPPVASRLVEVKHNGAVRELRFKKDD